ncbi:hypothetical protein [Achromobacter insolitus]|uniref:hypothetical protein n=1 Tax=Achromobacter insolitus TaxID=217204 RepID=UPI001EEE78BF|nr:hypothetical protein [Achromobacter insolitus]
MEPTKIERAIALINERPGIRSPEIEEALDTTSASALLAPALKRGEVFIDRIQAQGNGRWVTAYFPRGYQRPEGGVQTQPERDVSRPRQVRTPARSASSGAPLVAALYTNGDLVIEVGHKSLRLSADQTRDLVTYLDRVNIDQIVPLAR